MRSTLLAALTACADECSRRYARRFLRGLSFDELQFIAGFVGARILDSLPQAAVDRGMPEEVSPDHDLKMILVREYFSLSRIGRALDTDCSGRQSNAA